MNRQKKADLVPLEQKRLLTVKEAAVYLAVSPTMLYHWENHDLRPVRLRKKAIRFDRRDLDKLIEKLKATTGKEVRNDGTLQARSDMVDGLLS
jgi:excisionase family DNA binding protein